MRLHSFLVASLFVFSCQTPNKPDIHNQNDPDPEPQPAPKNYTAVLPSKPTTFAPSFVTLVDGVTNGEALTDIEFCGKCHQDVAAMWKTSAHAYASFDNPIYRMSVERTRREAGKTESKFCAGCHDIALLTDGVMDQEIQPEDKRAHAGINCRACHGVASATVDGNGSFVLTNAEIPIPVTGDTESVKRHVARVASPTLRTTELCASCHRAFLGKETGNTHFFAGMDDFTPWSRSVFAGSYAAQIDEKIEPKDCRGCHMPMEDSSNDAAATNGKVASHRFLGGHTWLAAMRNDTDTLQRVQKFLQSAVSLDIPVASTKNGERFLPAEKAVLVGGESLILDVVVRNNLVGHRFPGGTLDSQDTWLEVAAFDKSGKQISQTGADHKDNADDKEAHVFRAFVVGEGGVPMLTRETHKFRAVVYNSTIPPREASVVQYQLNLPSDLPAESLPIKVVATLRHRNKNLALQKASCDDMKEVRSASFASYTTQYRGETLDPCAPQPITDIATAEVILGGEPSDQKAQDWSRFYAHAFGMIKALQERVGEARPSLEYALSLLTPSQSQERAMVLAALAMVEVRQGRLEEALATLEKAEIEAPGNPALDVIRGDAYAQVWRWASAISPYQSATKETPNDPMAWVKFAIAAGSADQPEIALSAAQSGLALEPRNADLLRVQALALQSLKSPLAAEALDAYLLFRPLDTAPGMRGACSMKVANCALERNPVHVHELK